jgi:hypothetical protein
MRREFLAVARAGVLAERLDYFQKTSNLSDKSRFAAQIPARRYEIRAAIHNDGLNSMCY